MVEENDKDKEEEKKPGSQKIENKENQLNALEKLQKKVNDSEDLDDKTFNKVFNKVILLKTIETLGPPPSPQYPPWMMKNPEENDKTIDMILKHQEAMAEKDREIQKMQMDTYKEQTKMLAEAIKDGLVQRNNEDEPDWREDFKDAMGEWKDSLSESFEKLKERLPVDMQKKGTMIEQLTTQMQEQNNFNKALKDWATTNGLIKEGEKMSPRDIANMAKDFIEPLGSTIQSIMGIAQEGAVKPVKKDVPLKNHEEGGIPSENSKSTEQVIPHAEGQLTTKKAGEEKEIFEEAKLTDLDIVPEGEISKDDWKSVSGILETVKTQTQSGVKDVVVFKGENGHGSPLGVQEGRVLSKEQFGYLWMNDPKFRKDVQDLVKKSKEEKK